MSRAKKASPSGAAAGRVFVCKLQTPAPCFRVRGGCRSRSFALQLCCGATVKAKAIPAKICCNKVPLLRELPHPVFFAGQKTPGMLVFLGCAIQKAQEDKTSCAFCMAHPKELESLTFGSVDQRSIQLS